LTDALVCPSCAAAHESHERFCLDCGLPLVRAGDAADAEMTAELQSHVKRVIAPYKYPREVEFVSSLPKTATGKLQRFSLRDRSPESSVTEAPR